jgi:1-acyl-sn-glycerol-3-phosphate acyltransferase
MMSVAAPNRRSKACVVSLAVGSGLLICFAAPVLFLMAIVTVFRARRFYSRSAALLARTILRLWGIRLVVHQCRPLPAGQLIYVSNHSSTLDLFVLVALGLPNTRFFLSGFLRKYVPLGVIAYLMGTFFTVPQNRPAERVRIFQRAERTLRRTRESVYLSPEGGRIVTGEIGRFNKGAFHLATNLKATIVPLYFQIPPDIDPGHGYNAQPGTVHIYIKPPIDTQAWRLEDLEQNKEYVRELFLRWHQEIRGAHGGRFSDSSAA